MSIRTLIILLLALGLLGGLVAVNKRKQAQRMAVPGPSEEMLIPLDKLNDIARFTLVAGTDTLAVARSGDRWVVESLWNYPASFDHVADNLRKLADVKCGEIVYGGKERLEEFGLALTTNANRLPPATIVFYDASGKNLRKITMGSPRMPKATGGRPQFPESGYVLLDDNDVRLVAAYLPGIPRTSDGWIDTSLVSVPAENVDEVSVTLTNGESYRVTRKVDGTFAADGLQENEAVNKDGAGTLAGALGQLNVRNVIDPALSAEATGLDKPSIYRAKTRDGFIYTVKVGRAEPASYGRYVRVDVGYEKPEPPSVPATPPATDTNTPPADPMKAWEEKVAADALKASAESERLSKWTFLLLEGDCQSFTMSRTQVVTVATSAPDASAASSGTTQTSAPTSPSPMPGN